MSEHEQIHQHSENAPGKHDDCCGGAHDHGSAKPDTHVLGNAKKPITGSTSSHKDASHVAAGSCGCGGKHK